MKIEMIENIELEIQDLVNKGLLKEGGTDKNGKVVYELTPFGEEIAEKIALENGDIVLH